MVVDFYRALRAFGLEPMVHDPLADAATIQDLYGVSLTRLEELRGLHVLILAVPHKEYAALDAGQLSAMLEPNGIFVDLKSVVPPAAMRSDIQLWAL
jgi:UDP-N-acetyl-D-galactosamine dehydrogenase